MKLLDLLTGAAFLAALGIVGTVEHGGAVSLMWWTLPCLAVMGAAAKIQAVAQRKKYFQRGSKSRITTTL